jgi:pimeloyl-ACP methyl ester carboxylesterase
MILASVLLASHLAVASVDASAPLPRRGTLGIPFTPVPADQAAKLELKPGEGLVAMAPLPGLTADKAGLKAGDIVTMVNGKVAQAGAVAPMIRDIPAGTKITFKVLRDGKTVELSADLTEKPRDPGNANYEVIYSNIVSNGQRMRTMISKPKKAGKHPAFFFIQGFSPVSYDYTLEGKGGDVTRIASPLIYDFANTGFVTLRIEKPGVGDSEGGPFATMDYTTELDIYRQALKQLKGLDYVDTDNIFIFGHSMGGAFGPMIAAESPVKGIATYGTAARTWYEYLLDTVRYQGLLAGNSFVNADDELRQTSRLFALIFHEGKSAEDVKKSHPQLAALCDAVFPGGLFNQKSLEFWRQLGQFNFPSYWVKADTYAFAIRGASDFVTYDADHKLIADAVNQAHPGKGKWISAPNLDHLMHNWPTEAASMKEWTKGEFNPSITTLTREWIDEIMKKPTK